MSFTLARRCVAFVMIALLLIQSLAPMQYITSFVSTVSDVIAIPEATANFAQNDNNGQYILDFASNSQ